MQSETTFKLSTKNFERYWKTQETFYFRSPIYYVAEVLCSFFSSSIVAFIYMHANSFTTLHTYCDETIHSNQKTGCFQINGYRLLSFLQTQNKILMRAFNILTFYQSTLGNLQGLSSSPCTPPAIHFMKRFQFYNKR